MLIALVLLLGLTPMFGLTWDELVQKANNGDAEAMRELGAQYYHGQNVTKDLNKAFQWMLKAAENGNPERQYACSVLIRDRAGGRTRFFQSILLV